MPFQFEMSAQENIARDWEASLQNVGAQWREYIERENNNGAQFDVQAAAKIAADFIRRALNKE